MTITDKQVATACQAAFDGWKSYSKPERDALWTSMRAALEAAEAVRETPEDRAGLVRHALKLMQQSQPWDGKTFNPELSHTLQLLAAAPSSAEQPAKTDRHARIGSTTFNPGVPVEVVIGRAYDEYDYRQKKVMQTGTQQCDTRPVDVAPINEPVGATPSAPEADERDMFELYKSWPADVRAKLSCHDLRRMNIAARAQSSAAPSVVPASARNGEAVAWQLKCRPGGAWRECTRETFERGHCGVESHKCEVRALYTAPPADARDGELLPLYREFYDAVTDHFDNTHGVDAPRDGDPWWHRTNADYVTRDLVCAIETADRARLDARADRAMGGE